MNVMGFLGDRIVALEPEIILQEGGRRLLGGDFGLQERKRQGDSMLFCGAFEGMELEVRFQKEGNGTWMQLKLRGAKPLFCEKLGWSLKYQDKGKDLSAGRVPCMGKYVADSGLHGIGEKRGSKPDTRLSGLFLDAKSPCIFLGSRIPQKNIHLYETKLLEKDTVLFRAVTSFPEGQQKKTELESEETLLLLGLTPREALQEYGSHVPLLEEESFAAPLVGWSSWDYYFSAVSQADIQENLEMIGRDPRLRTAIKYFFVDDGWQNREGEWYPNYRFPEGLEYLAEEIQKSGMIPGIWTNGCQVQELSYPALRMGEMLLKDIHGVPLKVNGMYVVDPTHPMGAEYLSEIYTRLYQYGFRAFKVDFVDSILEGSCFFDTDCGPYDVIRRIFTIVRKSTGRDSHIIGCSYPAECGAGYTDSCRIGVDIHNHWGHVRWVLEYLQLSFWENGRLFRIDPDFLIVRGKETSQEEETNVYNPFANIPYREGAVSNRWRRGEVFDKLEAETWANIVVFSGGNLILSDRLSMLNEQGMELLYTHLKPAKTAAIPLDLGERDVSGCWYLEGEQECRLLLVNHEDTAQRITFSFAEYGLIPPETLHCEKGGSYKGGVFTVYLERHESAVIGWTP